MKRKFIDNLNISSARDVCNDSNDDRMGTWIQENNDYGFDSRETWNLDIVMVELLYERLKKYLDVSTVNLEFHTYDVDGVLLTQKQVIDKIIENCEIVLVSNHNLDSDMGTANRKKDIWIYWSIIENSMWW